MQRSKPSLLEGAIAGHVLRLAIPVLIGMSFQTLYLLADLYFVGLLGGKPVAGLVIALNAFFVVLTISQAIGVGALALISQSWGRNEHDKARNIYTQTMWLTLGIGSTLAVLGYFGTTAYVAFFTSDPETQVLGAQYFSIYSFTFLTHLFLMVNGFCFRGSGDFVTPMKMMLVSVLLNIALDPILIFGFWVFPKLGLKGAAIATITSQIVAVSMYVAIILRRKKNLYLSPCCLQRETALEILKIGVPSGIQYLVLSVMMILTYRWIRPLGAYTTASVGVGFRILHASYLPMICFAVATASMVGQNWGAKLYDRVRCSLRFGLIYANTWAIIITTLFVLFPNFFVALFTDEQEVIDKGIVYLRVFGLSNYLVASIMVLTSAFQGLGKTVTPLIGATLKMLLFAAVWLFAFDSSNLNLIYGSAVVAIAVELIWDGLWIPRFLRPKERYAN